jgi:predicted RNA methylase
MSLTIIKKTEISKLDTFNKWKQNPGKGEVFTPNGLVNEILDQIPTEIWEDPKSTFCDLSMGKGTFLIEIVNRLVYIYNYTEEDAKSRVFGYDIRVKYINYLKRRGYKNVFHKDSLTEKFNMEFDVVLGNPPYQEVTGASNAKAIWPKFVQKSFDICKEDGYVSLIHPSGWRDVKGNFSHIKDLLKSKNIKYLNVNDFNKGKEVFGVGTNFDWYVVENCNNKCGLTKINTTNNVDVEYCLDNMEVIPNHSYDLINPLIYTGIGEKINLLNSESTYAHRKQHMSKEQTEDYVYPCVYTITQKDGINFWYSKVNNGHIGQPKVIWSNGLGTYPILDLEGHYGLMEYSFAIIDEPQNLPLIKKVMESDIFTKLMDSVRFINHRFQWKTISTFRKDFWKDFLDENNNVIEPNYNNAE